MVKYVIKRILIFIPTIIAISLLTFVISLNAPGDPVEQMLNMGQQQGQIAEKLATEKSYLETRHNLGLDLPVFYFSFTNLANCDTLYKIQKLRHRVALARLINQYGNWPEISDFYYNIRNLEDKVYGVKKDATNATRLTNVREYCVSLLESYDDKDINDYISKIGAVLRSHHSFMTLIEDYNNVINSYNNIHINQTKYKNYIPVVQWYGFNTQYHNWIVNFMMGDFGISYQDKRKVSSVIWDAIGWTMMISILSMIIAYLVAIPLGVFSAVKKDTLADRSVSTLLFVLYSLPNFWIATMLIMFLGGGDYLDWFPSYGLSSLPTNAPFLARFSDTAYHLVLPLICWTYGSFAFLSRQMRGGMLNVIGQDYIRTAKAKGLPDNIIIWKHAFRNSLIPIITLFANVFPAAIGGSFILENIFSIPGMGKITLDAIYARNYPIIFTTLMFSAILTLIGYLVADILYAMVDPRISYSSKKSS
ncbi:MAG: ABC transporter permease [Bacteroidia bacterium]|nr:ABC transporter permease [Bacteroidia bacterium]